MPTPSDRNAVFDLTTELPISALTLESKDEDELSKPDHTVQSAASRVFGTVELLGMILDKVPPVTLLKARAVSRTIQTAIETTPGLKSKIPPFLIDSTRPRYPTLMYKLKYFTNPIAPSNILTAQPLSICKAGLKYHFPVRRGKLTSALLEEHSLKNLQLTNPPTAEARFYYACACYAEHGAAFGCTNHTNSTTGLKRWEYKSDPSPVIRNSDGVTFGELFRAVEKDCSLTCQSGAPWRANPVCVTVILVVRYVNGGK